MDERYQGVLLDDSEWLKTESGQKKMSFIIK